MAFPNFETAFQFFKIITFEYYIGFAIVFHDAD